MNYILTVFGCLFSVAGIPLAIHQLNKTKSAADAARNAAEANTEKINHMTQVVSANDAIHLCREIQTHAQNQKHIECRMRLQDLKNILIDISDELKSNNQTISSELSHYKQRIGVHVDTMNRIDFNARQFNWNDVISLMENIEEPIRSYFKKVKSE